MSLRKLLATFVVASMVLGLVGTAVFAEDEVAPISEEAADEAEDVAEDVDVAAPAQDEESILARMIGFGIIQGDEQGNLNLDSEITRAEAITIVLRLLGLDEYAGLLVGQKPFTDVTGGWYEGYVALAKNRGLTTGYEDGTFRPNAPISYAEILALLSRAAGLQPAAAAWPMNYVKAAVDAGLVPADLDIAALANVPATRGDVVAIADAYALEVPGANGKTLFQNLKGTAPMVALNPLPGQTTEGTVAVSGTTTDAVSATLNGEPLALAADGSFSASVKLSVGVNTIKVTAVDNVNTAVSATALVELLTTPATSISAPATLSLKAAASAELGATVLDANGNAIAGAAIAAAVEPEGLVSVDAATGTVTAGTKAGTGTLTLTSGDVSASVAVTVNPGDLAALVLTPSAASVKPGTQVSITTKGQDAFGNEVPVSGVTYSVDGENALINPSTGTFIGSKQGTYKVTGTAGEVTGETNIGVYGDVAKIEVTGPGSVIGNRKTEAEVTIRLLDKNGNLITADDQVNVSFDATAFESDDVAAAGEDITVKGGVAKVKVRGLDLASGFSGVITVTREPGDDEDVDKLKTEYEMEIIEQVATSLKAKANKYLSVNEVTGSEQTVTVEVLDQAGEKMRSGLWDIAWEINGPARDDQDDKSGEIVAAGPATELEIQPYRGQTGEVVVTFTSEGLGSAVATLQAVVAQTANKLGVTVSKDTVTASDQPAKAFTVTVEIQDRNGVYVSRSGGTDVKITLSDKDLKVADEVGGGGPVPDGRNGMVIRDGAEPVPDADEKNNVELTIPAGQSKASFKVVLTKAGKYTLTAKAKDLSDASAGVTVDPAAVAKVVWTRSDDVLVPVNAATATLTAEARDQFDNLVAKAVAFEVAAVKEADPALDGTNKLTNLSEDVTLNGRKKSVAISTNEAGKAQVEIEARSFEGDYDIVAVRKDSDGDRQEESRTTVRVMERTPARVSVELRDVDHAETFNLVKSPDVAADQIFAFVKVVDQYGKAISVDPADGDDKVAKLLKLTVTKGEWSDVPAQEGRTKDHIRTAGKQTDVYAVFPVFAIKSGRINFGVELNTGVVTLKANAAVNAQAAAAYSVRLVEAEDTNEPGANAEIALKANDQTKVTLRLVDAWGNNLTSSGYHVAVSGGSADLGIALGANQLPQPWNAAATFALKGGQQALYVRLKKEFTHADVTFHVYEDDGNGAPGAALTDYVLHVTKK